MKKRKRLPLALLLFILLAAACERDVIVDPDYLDSDPSALDLVQSEHPRNTEPESSESDLEILVQGNSAFALDLYQQLRKKEENFFCSPYSVSMALAMTYAGARGKTETQMAETLHFTLSQQDLHPAINALDLRLEQRAQGNPEEGDPGFQLNTTSSLWGQKYTTFEEVFLNTLAENYGAKLRLLDFFVYPEESRQVINAWVEEQTEERIIELLSWGSITETTRLILVNTIYFNAPWKNEFDETLTQDEPFYLLNEREITVPMMHQVDEFNYLEEEERYQAIELPYQGCKFSMLILLPDEDMFEEFEDDFNTALLEQIIAGLTTQKVELTLPKFGFESSFSLSGTLKAMGMKDPFDFGPADFSGMDGTQNLFISEVVHQSFIDVDEEGTEAAAATAVEVADGAAEEEEEEEEPVELIIDRPFLFLIRDRYTGTIFFLGRVLDPQR